MSLRGFWADTARGFLDLLFAPVCLGCGGAIPPGEPRRVVCGVCWARARVIPVPRCERCWSPSRALLPAAACIECGELPPSVRGVRSAYLHDGPVRRLVHGLKYGGWSSLAEPMGARMASVPLPLEAEEEIRIVVPVPLTPTRLRQRGYNQAELLAREISRLRGWKCAPEVLLRGGETRTQTALHPSERRANVAGAFRAGTSPVRIDGEHLLLVDDVWTTGATSLACSEALIRAGARAVSVLTFARALPDLER